MVYMTVDWPGEIPLKWKYHLQTALQVWCSQQHFNEQKCTVNEVQLLGDGRTAEVEITPSTGENVHYFCCSSENQIEFILTTTLLNK